MKKATLIAAAGIVALAAQAQYQVNPSTEVVVKGGVKYVDYITLSDGAINELKAGGATVDYIGPDSDNGRNLWYWESGAGNYTFAPGDESFPRVDMEEGGYISVVVTSFGWSGAGLNVAADKGLDLSKFDDNTMFHMAYMTPTGNGPASIALILFDGEQTVDNKVVKSDPVKCALGDAFNDNGAIFPSIGAKITDDWQGVEISLGDLKKLWPTFNLQNKTNWAGNLFSWLGGGIQGQSMAFDAIYFYNRADGSGVNDLAADSNVDFVVTANTVNVMGANGIKLYNLAGQLVKSTEGTTLGISGLDKGVYIVNSANKTKKIVVK